MEYTALIEMSQHKWTAVDEQMKWERCDFDTML